MANKKFQVEVAYATLADQCIIPLTIDSGCTIEQVIEESGITALFPEIDLTQQKVGIFSKPKKLSDLVANGDRIEIYRPLLIDPMESRRNRASKT